jgi:hypothetical protein
MKADIAFLPTSHFAVLFLDGPAGDAEEREKRTTGASAVNYLKTKQHKVSSKRSSREVCSQRQTDGGR